MPTYYSEERMRELGWLPPENRLRAQEALREMLLYHGDHDSPIPALVSAALGALEP